MARVAVSLAVIVGSISLQNYFIFNHFPHLSRVTTDFSPAYLRRELQFLAATPPEIIFLGDSVLWGYRLNGDQTAVSILRSRGCPCRNLAFKSGNPPNDYFLTRLLLASGIRPRLVVLDVNQAVLNQSSDYYQSLHPALAVLADPFLRPNDRTILALPPRGSRLRQRFDDTLSALSQLYAMRSDIRETVFRDTAAAAIPRHLTPELFEGTYDLIPLDDTNVGVRFLEKTVELWRHNGVPVLAFLTPTNHALLHRYIDNSHYDANIAFLEHRLGQRGARILNLDDAFPANDFLDNAHLSVPGQHRLASRIACAIGAYGRCIEHGSSGSVASRSSGDRPRSLDR